MESEQHKKVIEEIVQHLERSGIHAINAYNKRPDIIATKDGKIIAVEIISRRMTKKGFKSSHSSNMKIKYYSMYDEVIVYEFTKDHYNIPGKANFVRVINNKGEKDGNN